MDRLSVSARYGLTYNNYLFILVFNIFYVSKQYRSERGVNTFIVLFVCTGNICRSPMAEGILKDLIIDEFDRRRIVLPIEVASAGTHAYGGHPASRHAVDVAKAHDINLTFHRSRHLASNLVNASDLILTMESAHRELINSQWPHASHVHELKRYMRETGLDFDADVLDPIGADRDVYAAVFDELKEEITRVAPHIFSLVEMKARGGDSAP